MSIGKTHTDCERPLSEAVN